MYVMKLIQLVTVRRILLGFLAKPLRKETIGIVTSDRLLSVHMEHFCSYLMEFTKTFDQLNLVKVGKEQHTLYLKTYVSYIYEYSLLLVTLVITVSMFTMFPEVSILTLITCVVHYRQLSFNSFYTEIKLSHNQ
jgi:hypothetical protein